MARLMSVAFTEQAVRERRKTVTRRKGWWQDKHGRQIVKPGDTITLCRKVMGRKAGEPLERICDVEVVSIRREPLVTMCYPGSANEATLEGFPDLTPEEFIDRYFVKAQGMSMSDWVTRIEWRYLDGGDPS